MMAPSNLNRVTFDSVNNVVKGERLREVQKKVLSKPQRHRRCRLSVCPSLHPQEE